FPSRIRVTAMAIAQNLGTMLTALLPALFATVAPPGSAHIPATIGTITFAITVVAAVAGWSARETFRVALCDLGDPGAVPIGDDEYRRLRAEAATREPVRRIGATEQA